LASREHPAEEVFVTGTFDNWTKSVKLEKEGGVFLKTVELKEPEKKIYYKVGVSPGYCTSASTANSCFVVHTYHTEIPWHFFGLGFQAFALTVPCVACRVAR
jgi:hypothetical protein